MDWYILQVHSGTEKKVEKELLAQLEKKGLKNNIEKFYQEDKRFWSPPQLLQDLVNNGRNFDSLN